MLHATMQMILKSHAMKSATEWHILYDFIYMRCPE